jgi:hypothetical protein
MCIWLDDERDPKDPVIQEKFWATGDEVWVKTADEVILLLLSNEVEFISFDHDLGESQRTGYDVAKFIEAGAENGTIDPMGWRVHSQNSVGAANIRSAMHSAERWWDNNA